MDGLDEDIDEKRLAFYEAVYTFVRTVPQGKVVTYGQVADCVISVTLTARQVGTAMRYAPSDVPWQRVVGAGGRLPIAKLSPEAMLRQRTLLVAEGVCLCGHDENRIDMTRSHWNADAMSPAEGDLFGVA